MDDAGDLLKIDTPHGAFWSRENDFVTAQLREYGGHQRSELGLLLDFTRPGDVVVDVGAHIGTISIPLGRRVGETGRVFSLEPMRESFEILCRNIETNGLGDRITATHAIVTDQPGSCWRIHASRDHTSAAHFSPEHDEEGFPIPSLALDDFVTSSGGPCQRLDLLKIDTEGMELRVLESAHRSIARFKPVVMAEMSGRHLARQGDSVVAVGRFLAGFGYHFFRNLGPRHATSEAFGLMRLWRPHHVRGLYDLVAVHPTDPRYPARYASPWPAALRWVGRRARGGLRRMTGL